MAQFNKKKQAILDSYVSNLKATYPTIYVDGMRPLILAIYTAEKALEGLIRLEGDCWHKALKDNGFSRATMMTRKQIKAIGEPL